MVTRGRGGVLEREDGWTGRDGPIWETGAGSRIWAAAETTTPFFFSSLFYYKLLLIFYKFSDLIQSTKIPHFLN